MGAIKFFKVNSLPTVLEPNSIYLVNTSGVLSIHVSDNTGTNSIQLSGSNISGGLIPYPVKKDAPKLVGDFSTYPLATLGLVRNRLYMIPYVTPRFLTLTNLKINVVKGKIKAIKGVINPSVSIGIYNNTKTATGDDNPYQLLASVNNLSTATAGDKILPVNFQLQPNTLYWFGVMSTAGATLRAVSFFSVASSLGRIVNSNIAVTHLYKDYIVFGLPTIAPVGFLNGVGNIPGIYLIE